MPSRPHLLLVVGAGRSGTSAFAGSIAALGYAVPLPEVKGDSTNPRGFGEPRWAVEFHRTMLEQRKVDNFDSRPYAWKLALSVSRASENQARLNDWLHAQFAQHERIVVKDPRTVWFLNMWRSACRDLDADHSIVTMLRPPAEVVASARRWYSGDHFETSRLAGWVNVQLRTEKMTREDNRAFVRYDDLLADTIAVMKRIDTALGLRLDLDSQPAVEQVRSFLDPALRREHETLEQLDVVPSVRSIADRVWAALDAVAANDNEVAHATLDSLRAEYRRLYLDAEQIAIQSIRTRRIEAKPLGRRNDDSAADAHDPDQPADAADADGAEQHPGT